MSVVWQPVQAWPQDWQAQWPAPWQDALAPAWQARTVWQDSHTVWHRWGPLAAPALLLLHGGSGSWMHWARNISALLAAGYQVLAVDLPGSGDSDLPEGALDAPDLPPHLHAGLAQIWPAQRPPLALLGFSFGALTAALWLQAHPHDAQALVLVGTPGLGLNSPERTPLKGWRHLPPEQHASVHRHNLLALMCAHESTLDPLVMALHAHNAGRDRLTRRRISRTDVLAQALPDLKLPVAVLFGALDALYVGRMHEVQALLQARLPDLRAFEALPDAGHWVAYEAAPAFEAALLRSLQALGLRP